MTANLYLSIYFIMCIIASILNTAVGGGDYCSHPSNEESKAQRGYMIGPRLYI